VADAARRHAERVAAAGDLEAQAQVLADRVRVGELPPRRLAAAAALGHLPAQLATGLPAEPGVHEQGQPLWELPAATGVALALDAVERGLASATRALTARIRPLVDRVEGAWSHAFRSGAPGAHVEAAAAEEGLDTLRGERLRGEEGLQLVALARAVLAGQAPPAHLAGPAEDLRDLLLAEPPHGPALDLAWGLVHALQAVLLAFEADVGVEGVREAGRDALRAVVLAIGEAEEIRQRDDLVRSLLLSSYMAAAGASAPRPQRAERRHPALGHGDDLTCRSPRPPG